MEPQNFICHTWLSDERIVAGTDNGRLLLFESGELKNEFSVTGTSSSSLARLVANTLNQA